MPGVGNHLALERRISKYRGVGRRPTPVLPNLRSADDVTKWVLRHALTSMPPDPHPLSHPAKKLYFCMVIIDECSINLEIR